MKRIEIKEGYRLMRFEELYEQWFSGDMTQQQAAQVLGVCERSFRRYVKRYKEQGVDSLKDGRLVKRGERRIPEDVVDFITDLYRDKYYDFNVSHYHETLRREHKFTHSYNWLRSTLQFRGVVSPLPKRGVYRRKRARKPMVGMMLHQDGSRHEWVAGRMDDLIVTLDDASNEIYSIFLVPEEGTLSTFQAMSEVIAKKGIFCSLYVDRGTHYAHTPLAGEKVSKELHTQVQRACKQLGVELIHAYSPQARGRSERMFRTLQGRLPQELRVAGITTIEAANAYINEQFLPRFNAGFVITPAHPSSAFSPYIGRDLNMVLCVQEERTVRNDNTVSFNNKVLQIDKDDLRYHYVRCKVTVCTAPDGTITLAHGPRIIATYRANGTPHVSPENQEAA